MQVDQSFINTIEGMLSTSRLSSYKTYFNCANDAEVLGVYMWNKSVAMAFFPLLQATEITLRNAIHTTATAHFSGNTEWYRSKSRFPTIQNEIRKKYYNRSGSVIAPTPSSDDVVSQLMFGFWVNLLTHNLDDPVNHQKLWPTLIPSTFPNAHGSNASRSALHQRFKFIKDFRNRVGHYEPLWKIRDAIDGGGNLIRQGPTTPSESIQRLNEYIDLIIEALKWMSFERHDFVVGTGLVEHVKALCSLDALDQYQHKRLEPLKYNRLQQAIRTKKKQTGSVAGIYRFSTPPKGVFSGEEIVLDIKQIRPPKLK